MKHNRSLSVRIHARLHADERGFSLIETVIAAGIIFTALLTLAFAATAGFGYQDLSRQRQAGTGLANRIMEEVRGLAYQKIQSGLLSTDLAGDPNIVDCSGVKRFLSCTPNPQEPGTGEAIVISPGLATTTPLVPHRSSTSPNTDPVLDGTTYKWATYVTRDTAVANAAYRVTVIVTWSGGLKGQAPNKLVRVQSLFWSPGGCRNTATHPFAAPCQPFLYGSASVPRASVRVEGTIDQLAFGSGEILSTGASSSVQQEQIQKAQGAWQGAEVVLVDSAGAEVASGGTKGSSNADSDPATTTPVYGRYGCPLDVSCVTGSLQMSANGNTFTLSAPTATAETDSTTATGGTNVCPPTPATPETDGLLCSGAQVTQGGAMSATLDIAREGLAPGAITLAQISAPVAASTTLVHRNAYPSATGCTPTSTTDGCVALGASRSVGTVNVGGLPAGFAPPAGWAGADPWNGYLLSVVGFTDSVSASAGTDSPVPTAAQSGTVYYWNGAGYSSLSVTDAGLGSLASSVSLTQDIGGRTLTLEMSTAVDCCSAGSTSFSPTSPGTLTEVVSTSVPPTIRITYRVLEGASVIADLTIDVNLRTLEARGTYAAAPVEGITP